MSKVSAVYYSQRNAIATGKFATSSATGKLREKIMKGKYWSGRAGLQLSRVSCAAQA